VAAPVLAAVSAATVGAVLASRRPRHPVGWLLLASALCLNASGVAWAYADYGLLARPGAVSAAAEVSLYLPAIIVPALAMLGFVLLLNAHRVAALAPLAVVGTGGGGGAGGQSPGGRARAPVL
jgi:hypothetical protein